MSYVVNVNTKCAHCYRGDDDVLFWQFVNFSRDGSKILSIFRSFRITFLHISVCVGMYVCMHIYIYISLV